VVISEDVTVESFVSCLLFTFLPLLVY
jgi:hypothetical protein